MARLFRAAAEAETVHAHTRTLGEVKSTAENLKDAIAGETHEFREMYSAMIEIARQEGDKATERSFRYTNEVEIIHAELYRKALEKMEHLKEVDYYVCAVCGHTCENGPPEKCPVCNAVSKAYFKVD